MSTSITFVEKLILTVKFKNTSTNPFSNGEIYAMEQAVKGMVFHMEPEPYYCTKFNKSWVGGFPDITMRSVTLELEGEEKEDPEPLAKLLVCPQCHSSEHLKIAIETEALLEQGRGNFDTSEIVGDHVWSLGSYCSCTNCDWGGTVGELNSSHEGKKEKKAPSLPLNSFKVLNISTCHLTKRDDDLLMAEDPPVPVEKTNCGYIVSTAQYHEKCGTGDLSWAFDQILQAAYMAGYDYMWFDAAGQKYDQFSVFKW